MLEAALYEDNAFATLTYDEENVPRMGGMGESQGTLDPKDLQDWLKRFRDKIKPLKIRFYAVGEYGSQSERPHYHVALFGYPGCQYGVSRYSKSTHSCCGSCDLVKDTWGLGNVLLGTLSVESAQYICGYVTKKMTRRDDLRLNGRHPEFSRMSLRPGIGADFMHEVASTLMQFNLDKSEDDVPSSLRHGSRTLPLGRYLRRRLRKLTGKEENAPQATIDKISEEMRPLLEASKADPNNPSLKSQILIKNKQPVLNMLGRANIFKGKKTL